MGLKCFRTLTRQLPTQDLNHRLWPSVKLIQSPKYNEERLPYHCISQRLRIFYHWRTRIRKRRGPIWARRLTKEISNLYEQKSLKAVSMQVLEYYRSVGYTFEKSFPGEYHLMINPKTMQKVRVYYYGYRVWEYT